MDDDPWKAQMAALGAFIKTQRRLADLSLREMADLTRVSNAYLSQVERGLHQPSVKVLRSIAQALNLSSERLLAQAGLMDQVEEAPAGGGASSGAEASDAAASATEAVILADPRLTNGQRQALVSVYRSFVSPGG